MGGGVTKFRRHIYGTNKNGRKLISLLDMERYALRDIVGNRKNPGECIHKIGRCITNQRIRRWRQARLVRGTSRAILNADQFNVSQLVNSQPQLSPMQVHKQVDAVSEDASRESIVLSLVETRPWGDRGENLPDVQKKIYAYLDFVESGEVWAKFPTMRGRKIVFRVHTEYPTTPLEDKFFVLARTTFLDPLGIFLTVGR
jgi:hypothetical protein